MLSYLVHVRVSKLKRLKRVCNFFITFLSIYIMALGVIKQMNREEVISSCHVLNVNHRSHEHEPQNYAASLSQTLQTKIGFKDG